MLKNDTYFQHFEAFLLEVLTLGIEPKDLMKASKHGAVDLYPSPLDSLF